MSVYFAKQGETAGFVVCNAFWLKVFSCSLYGVSRSAEHRYTKWMGERRPYVVLLCIASTSLDTCRLSHPLKLLS
jgi:hypothetical protein